MNVLPGTDDATGADLLVDRQEQGHADDQRNDQENSKDDQQTHPAQPGLKLGIQVDHAADESRKIDSFWSLR